MNTQTLQEFQYNGSSIQVLGDPDQPLFVAKEVCDALGLSDVHKATDRLDDDEKLMRKVFVSGQRREVIVINEPGLYNLVLRSTKPEAKKFKRWVTHEVLPAIRKKGYYATPGAVRRMVRQELAKERLAEYIYYSDLWDEDKLQRLVELEPHLTKTELAKVFDCGTTAVQKAIRLYRHAKGDFEDKRPDALKPDQRPQLSLIDNLKGIPASEADKEDIWRMREKDDLTYDKISEITGYSVTACRDFYMKEKARREVHHD